MNSETDERPLLTKIRERGFSSAVSALESFPPTKGTVEVATSLGLTAVQLGRLLRVESQPSDLAKIVARIFVGELYGSLGELGWRVDKSTDSLFLVVKVQISCQHILGRDIKDRLRIAVDQIYAATPPAGWIPTSVNDPIITHAFASWASDTVR